jgi:hypothetical protein
MAEVFFCGGYGLIFLAAAVFVWVIFIDFLGAGQWVVSILFGLLALAISFIGVGMFLLPFSI